MMKVKKARYAAAVMMLLFVLAARGDCIKAQTDIYEPVGIETNENEEKQADEKQQSETTAEASGETDDNMTVLKDIRVMMLVLVIMNGFTGGAVMASAGRIRHGG